MSTMTQTDYKTAYDRQCARVKELEKFLSEQIEHTSRAYRELAELEAELKIANIQVGYLQVLLNDANGMLNKDTCFTCNFLERGDCHAQKEELRVENRKLRAEIERIAELEAELDGLPELREASQELRAENHKLRVEIERMRPGVDVLERFLKHPYSWVLADRGEIMTMIDRLKKVYREYEAKKP